MSTEDIVVLWILGFAVVFVCVLFINHMLYGEDIPMDYYKHENNTPTKPKVENPDVLKQLIKLIIDLSDNNEDCNTKTDSNVFQCEVNLIFTAMILDTIINKCQDKLLVIKVVNGLIPELKDYLLERYKCLFEEINIDCFLYNRLTVYRSELREYENDPTFTFPKITYALYSNVFCGELKEMYSYENIIVNASIPIWQSSTRLPLRECLLRYNKE